MKRRQKGSDWYKLGVGDRMIRVERKDHTDSARKAAALLFSVILAGVLVHMAVNAFDRQVALQDAEVQERYSDFFAAR